MYALDTNTVIYFFKGQGRVAKRLLTEPPKNIHIPLVVIYELEVGILKSKEKTKEKRDQLERFLSVCSVLSFERKEARIAAKVRVELEQKGNPIGPLDILIAASTIANGLILVTHNIREFEKIVGLRLEDWY